MIKELKQKMDENEHRFFKIVEEYDTEKSRHAPILKEIKPDGQETL